MKSFAIAAILLGAVGLASAQTVQVKGESKLNTDFSKYKTFGWAKEDKTPQNEQGFDVYTYQEWVEVPSDKNKSGKSKSSSMKQDKRSSQKPEVYAYSYNVIIPSSNAAINTTVTSSIEEALEGRGYKNATNPDLIVTYRVLERKAQFKGYKNDSPTKINSGDEIRQPSDTVTYALEPGTLMIAFIDSKTSQLVWEGFASGLATDNAFTTDEAKVKQAVNLIFEKFKYRADKYGSN